jgi:UDP-N-acetyl-D-mannosaminuronate dehydrogenase
MRLTKLSAVVTCAFLSFVALGQAASAGTYMVPVTIDGDANGSILKITVANGNLRRVGKEGNVVIYEATMDGNACSSSVRVVFADDIDPLTVPYDVCSQEGFGVSITWR